MNAKITTRWALVLVLFLFVSGCVIGDELTTFTLKPDGSADLVVFRSNLHSTQKGEKAEKELAEYQANFDKQADGDFRRIRDAGGKVVLASWVRMQAPYSTVVHAHFPDTAALEKYWSMKDAEGQSLIATAFHKNGTRRRLTFRITFPASDAPDPTPPSDAWAFRQALANGISETRFALTEGSITSARGFTVAEDRQSALLNVREVTESIRAGQGNAELWLEWE